jgi:peroxiredoxin
VPRPPRALALLLCAALLPACTRGGAPKGAERSVVGQAVVTYVSPSARERGPALEGEAVQGGRLDAASFDGVTVVNVWGAWCGPCKEEQPALERAWRALRSRDVAFVGIDIRDEIVAARRHVERYDVTYPSLFDPSARLLTRFETVPKSPPATYVIDRSGKVAAYAFGVLDEPALVALVERVLGEAA